MHPPLNNHIQVLPAQLYSPPPDDMDFNDGENDPGPYKATQGVQTLHHPILNGMSSILPFFCFNFNHDGLH